MLRKPARSRPAIVMWSTFNSAALSTEAAIQRMSQRAIMLYSLACRALASYARALFHLLKQPHRADPSKRADHVLFVLLDGELNGVSLGAKLSGLCLHGAPPTRVQFAHVHVEAQIRERVH